MYNNFRERLIAELGKIRDAGLYKSERVIESPQGAVITVQGKHVLNFCSNNYLGLCNHPAVLDAAERAVRAHGYGMSSVRFICATTAVHKELESVISRFLGTDDTILYSSCFDANGGLFETLLQAEDVVISDKLNHASIIDGIRLCKAERKVFQHGDMADLEAQLKASAGFRTKLIATDGVFSMDGDIANLKAICDLADRYGALVMVDDSHATGFVGAHGRGTHEYCGVEGRIDIITSTLGKALGGAGGGFTAARKEIVEYLRQRSRTYLFSNNVSPVVAATSIEVFRMLERDGSLREKLMANTKYFRSAIGSIGLDVRPGEHPIVPVMLYDAKVAQGMAADLLKEGIYVIGFSFPVVPEGQARIRVQISAAHTTEQLDRAVAAFEKIGKKHSIIK
ncbi:MAG: glycine C-acetyltransferase [Patescibacteria group bacterium]|nr:glycine C-acetyltransferase [Patescibacteria group bacterium]MDD5715262.1 glycine C-acetyltransferase [Patescibacteria group bacterium]